MLRVTAQIINKTLSIVPRACLSTTPVEKWDLFTAIAVERSPKIVPQMNEIEKFFQKQLSAAELERSCKSDFEIRHEADLKQAELLKKGDVDVDMTLKQTAQDFADASLEEINKFQFGNAITEDDKSKNNKSLNRKLDKNLLLLTEQKIGGKKYFLPPQGMRQDGESLRQKIIKYGSDICNALKFCHERNILHLDLKPSNVLVSQKNNLCKLCDFGNCIAIGDIDDDFKHETAERVLKESIGNDMKTQIYSNAPSGFYKYKYPKNIQNEKNTVGAKVFIYFARYNKGNLPEKGINYKWLDREEIKQEIPEKYLESLEMFLIDE